MYKQKENKNVLYTHDPFSNVPDADVSAHRFRHSVCNHAVDIPLPTEETVSVQEMLGRYCDFTGDRPVLGCGAAVSGYQARQGRAKRVR